MRKVEQMEIIVAVDENYGIGKNGDLLAHLSPDLKRLKAMTVGNIIVMGSKTYMSFPKRPLPILLSSFPCPERTTFWQPAYSIRKTAFSIRL